MKNRYIIVHLIRGEAKELHEAITKDLVDKFDTFPIHERIVPHLTLKRWFEFDAEEMVVVYKMLDQFVLSHKQSTYRLHGFNHFGDGVIYIDVEPSPEVSEIARDLMNELHKIQNMTFDEFDNIYDDLHATVAMRALKPFDFKETWDYLLTKQTPDFNIKFDNIAILRRGADKWVPEHIWELPVA